MSDIYWLLEMEINEGQAGDFEQFMNEMVAATRDNELGTTHYEWFSDGSTVHVYERYVDSAAVMAHLASFATFADRFMVLFAPTRFTVYGSPSDEVKEALAAFSPTYLPAVGGFSR